MKTLSALRWMLWREFLDQRQNRMLWPVYLIMPPLDAATALPVQIFMWATAAERGFVERTAGATLILLAFLVVMNVTAVILRRRYERRW